MRSDFFLKAIASDHSSARSPAEYMKQDLSRGGGREGNPTPCAEGGVRSKGLFKSSKLANPLVSIIIAVFNGAQHLEPAIRSVLDQRYENIELIIVDGGSQDESTMIIRKYEDRLDYWASAPDHGIYDAMNKGISLAKGDWLLFLGSDDRLISPDVIRQCMDSEFCLPTADQKQCPALIYGDVIYTNGFYFRSQLNFWLLLHNTIHHQAAMYNHTLFDSFRYDTTLRSMADYELNLLIYTRKYRTAYLGRPISICHFGGQSSSLARRRQNIHELDTIRQRHIPYPIHVCMSAIVHAKTFVRLSLPWQ